MPNGFFIGTMWGAILALVFNFGMMIAIVSLTRNDTVKETVCIEAKAKGYQLEQCEGGK